MDAKNIIAEIEEKALKAYPYDIQGQYAYDANNDKRIGYIKGYQEAIKQFVEEAAEGEYWDNSIMLDAGLRGKIEDGMKVKVIFIKED